VSCLYIVTLLQRYIVTLYLQPVNVRCSRTWIIHNSCYTLNCVGERSSSMKADTNVTPLQAALKSHYKLRTVDNTNMADARSVRLDRQYGHLMYGHTMRYGKGSLKKTQFGCSKSLRNVTWLDSHSMKQKTSHWTGFRCHEELRTNPLRYHRVTFRCCVQFLI
jgi:hypothetical protein